MGVLADGSLDPDGPVAESIADLWWLMLAIGAAVVVLFVALLARAFTRRADEEHDGDEVDEEEGGPLLRRFVIGGGVGLPVVVLIVVFGATVVTMREIPHDAPPGALEIELVGHQWWWEVRYPDADVVTANELHLPVGRPVAVRLISADVIHSFWVPPLAGKTDLLPDGVNTMVLEADEADVYLSQCAEFCGLQHALMELTVVAEEPARFDEWLEARAEDAAEPAEAAARRGLDLVVGECGECHTVAGTAATGTGGPDLTHVASRPSLAAGTLPNTADALARWIRDPASVKPGADMPAADLTDEELADVVAYLETLE